MKRIFSWFFTGYFLLGSISPNTDFAQLWHAAHAFRHFQLHQVEAAENGQLCTLWSFVRDHYINPESHHHNDTSDHGQLPVHHLHAGLDLILQQVVTNDSPPVNTHTRELIGFTDHWYSYLFNTGIDRPPSLA